MFTGAHLRLSNPCPIVVLQHLCFGFSGDDVFMPDSSERKEYVLEEFGILFVGNVNYISRRGWNYGQVNAK